MPKKIKPIRLGALAGGPIRRSVMFKAVADMMIAMVGEPDALYAQLKVSRIGTVDLLLAKDESDLKID